MPSYDFLNLSPSEFEDLSRDLLQKFLDIHLESFMPGPDGGIDLRHQYSQDKALIVQAKRYKDWEPLLETLKNELNNVRKLQPQRYIITTSVSLTPRRKEKIRQLFTPYILSDKDIYGQRDLNNLIGDYPKIERDHFKLWLSSVNILEKILHSRVVNQSQFEIDEIKEATKLYVQNDSYYKSLDIIKDKRYVIISGSPGIGKTTLARILAYHYLADGFEEFVYLSDSIDDAFGAFKEGVKQIFLFDDFLGRNFLDKVLKNNEEQRIVRFIEKVSKANDKILLLTTREYILAQAKLKYDIFDNQELEFAKCVIDLSQYTKLVRARILYNHLYFSAIPRPYLESLIRDKAYEKIILHKGYNPRIIDTATHKEVWQDIAPEDFANKILHYLTYPETIWKHVYENQITRFSQCLLANLLTMGVPVFLTDLKSQIQQFAAMHHEKYGITYSELDLKKSLRELENTFITINKDGKNVLTIDYANPSIQDFLVSYFQNSSDQIDDVLVSAKFFQQFFRIFSERYNEQPAWASDNKNRIIYSKRQLELITSRLISDFNAFQSLLIYKLYTHGTTGLEWRKTELSIFNKLNATRKFFPYKEYPQIREFIIERFKDHLYPERLTDEDFGDYMDLFEEFESECEYEPEKLIVMIGNDLNTIKQVKEFERLEMYHSAEFDKFTLNNPTFTKKLETVIAEEAKEPSDYELEDVLYDITNIGDKFNLDYSIYKDNLQERIDEYESRESSNDYWNSQNQNKPTPEKNEDKIIEELFRSLTNLSDNEIV